MRPGFFANYNNNRQTAQEIFTSGRKNLMKEAWEWFSSTSESCSVVAALIATVAYITFTTVPGGSDQETGLPTLEGQPAFQVFALSSLIALCFHESDFVTGLPTKLIGGLTTPFLSISANLISFFAGHFHIVHNKTSSRRVYFLYAGLSFPMTAFFSMSHSRLYLELIRATISGRPKESKKLHYS